MSMRFSEHGTFHDLDNIGGSDGEPGRQDVGGTNGQTDYVSMKNYARAAFFSVLGTWNGTDDLDECRIQQASDSSGTGVKDLTSDASGGNYDTDSPIDADGDFVIVEVRSEDLDIDSGFEHVRGYVAEGGNSGTDNVASMLLQYGYAYPRKELQGAASSGSQVYVSTGT
jgi:hypothetical protein